MNQIEQRHSEFSLNSQLINEAAAATLSGSMPFPHIVAKLMEAGVEYYHVDYVTLRKTFYGAGGAVVVTPITLENLPAITADFDAAALRAAILDSQQRGQKWREFTIRALLAGVQGYYAFLRGQRVTYLGRSGDQHTEWFPGAGPRRS